MSAWWTHLALGGAFLAAPALLGAQSDIKNERKYWRAQLEAASRRHRNEPAIYEAHMNLARIEERRGNPDWARYHLERALRFQEQTLGRDDVRVADTLVAMADFLERANYPAKCETVYECVPAYSSYEGDQPLPSCTYATECRPALEPNYQRVVRLLERALDIRRKHYGAAAPSLVPVLLKLCNAQQSARLESQARRTAALAREIARASNMAPALTIDEWATCTISW